MGKAQDLAFGDLIIDQTCLFARRKGKTIQFTRSERALLLALSRNPHRLMSRSQLLDAMAPEESDASDRNIDFLVNRLRAKLGDSAKSPMYIATQYGEGYVWIAAPSAVPIAAPSQTGLIDGYLAIAPAFAGTGRRFSKQVSSLVERLRDLMAAGVGAGHKVLVLAENWQPAAADKLHYFLQVSFHADNGRLNCAATLREMPSKRIVKAFGLLLDIADATSFASAAARVSTSVIGALRQEIADAATGLGTPIDAPPEARLQNAASLLSVSNAKWLASGEQLRGEREQDPSNADTALQWCLHLFARLVMTNPFNGTSLEERDRIESEIETMVLECLPAIEASPVLNLAAAKLLYVVNRGHLELAEDLAERAFARTSDFAAALPILGQLRGTRGNFHDAIVFFDRGITMPAPPAGFVLHMRVLKCIALLAAGDRAALEAVAAATDLSSGCPPEIALMIRLMIAPANPELPAALAQALAAVGTSGAVGVIEYVYFTGARQFTSEQARANVMRGLVAHVTSLHGAEFVPAFVLESTGLARQPEQDGTYARRRAGPARKSP